MLTQLAGPAQHEDLMELLDSSRVSDRGRILRAMAHAGGVPTELSLLREAREPAHAKDAVYAAGMSAHRDLAAMATSRELAGTATQRSADWWRNSGPAVTDPMGRLIPDDRGTEATGQTA
ncbi:hypothetical protein [Leekyejoonella antrihumi]|uniref:HEAT repeat domain-containing protein n=1 Tax=Leekyejoonella antrihumi TaxID=1660198 RepID=A0A563DU74_9MICO|nr:hypothetical protein [Leekyejoonella antrihumi]TWP33472.1 hypothetical protein FGL98_21170 [Leekyejoonella antrihumi]